VYVPAMALGGLLYIVVYSLLGFLFGPPVLKFIEAIHLPLGLLGSLVPLAIIVVWTWQARQGIGRRAARAAAEADAAHQLRAGAAAGGLATIGSTLFLNVLVN